MVYNPICKPNQLILGEADSVAIVTGWTPREAVAKAIDRSNYAVIGNLYSPSRGISFLLRNLLANPQVRFLILLKATKSDSNSGSIAALEDFFKFGFTTQIADEGAQRKIKTKIKDAILDPDLSYDALDILRSGVYVHPVKTLQEAKEKAFALSKINLQPWGQPIVIPPPLHQDSSRIGGQVYGNRVQGETIAETWVKIIHRIRRNGIVRPTGYDGKWQELIDLIAIVTDEPEEFYFPEPNYLSCDREFLANYLEQVVQDAPYKEGVKYTYGQRIFSWFGKDQLAQVIEKLHQDPDSASAVISLWDSGSGSDARFGRKPGESDHDHGGSPCLNHLWFRIVGDELTLTATFRSNDMFSAWPANAMGLRALQQKVVGALPGLSLGPLITISQSAHIYDDCWENADRLIAQEHAAETRFDDLVGNFIISVIEGEIEVEQEGHLPFYSGRFNRKYKGKHALKLIREIATENPEISPDHIGYLGIELQKAQDVLRQQAKGISANYTQDK